MPASKKRSSSDPERLNQQSLNRIAEIFRAFSEPTRLAILQELKDGPLSVNGIVDLLATSQANVSKQLKILHDARLLEREKRANQVFYSISDPLVFELCGLACSKLNRDAQANALPVDFAI